MNTHSDMKDNVELYSIFPTPVVKFKIPENFMRHVPSLKNRTNEKPHKIQSHIVSQNMYILDNLEYEDLRNWLILKSKDFMNTALAIDGDAILTQSWVNKASPGHYTHEHQHQNSFVSGVFYMDVPDDNALIVFHRPTMTQGYYMLEPKYYTDNQRDYSYVSRTYKMKVSSGELVLFPSWLIHSVPTNNTIFDRWSLAYNSLTANSIGVGTRLNEFVYPKT